MKHQPGVPPSAALLTTKLSVPPFRPDLVQRPDLIKRLNEGAQRKLTLVSAPAGFGKTTLLSNWCALDPHGARNLAWVSLDADDNDPVRFWTYVLAALETAQPEIVVNARELLFSHAAATLPASAHSAKPGHPRSQKASIRSCVTALINAVADVSIPLVLILDDYHTIEEQRVYDSVSFLLRHLPSQMHLIISGRAEPPLHPARLRAAAQLIELRAGDPRFTLGETGAFLNQMMGLNLATEDVAALEARTEGWIAGLQLAALSMQGQDDIRGFISDFTGSHRFILDYLVEEVLSRQSESVRTFLLETSILDQLNGLAERAVTGQPDGQRTLETLESANLFIIPWMLSGVGIVIIISLPNSCASVSAIGNQIRCGTYTDGPLNGTSEMG